MPYAPFQQNKKTSKSMKYMRQFSNFGVLYDVVNYVTYYAKSSVTSHINQISF